MFRQKSLSTCIALTTTKQSSLPPPSSLFVLELAHAYIRSNIEQVPDLNSEQSIAVSFKTATAILLTQRLSSFKTSHIVYWCSPIFTDLSLYFGSRFVPLLQPFGLGHFLIFGDQFSPNSRIKTSFLIAFRPRISRLLRTFHALFQIQICSIAPAL